MRKTLKYAFDAFKRVQNVAIELSEYRTDQKPITNKRGIRGLWNISCMMSPYTNWMLSYQSKLKRGEVPELPQKMIIKLEDISKEAVDWRTIFNATVRDYKQLRELYKQSFYNSDGTFDFVGWIP